MIQVKYCVSCLRGNMPIPRSKEGLAQYKISALMVPRSNKLPSLRVFHDKIKSYILRQNLHQTCSNDFSNVKWCVKQTSI